MENVEGPADARSILKASVGRISAAGVALEVSPAHSVAHLETAIEDLRAVKKYAEGQAEKSR